MKAVRFHEYGSPAVLVYEDVPDPACGPGDAVVRVCACSVQHVDLDMRAGVSRLPVQLPLILGSEFSGDVVEVGKDVVEVEVGDRVTPLHQLHCGACEWCRRGQFNVCENFTMLGVGRPGGYAEYAVVPAWALVRLPAALSYETAAAKNSFATASHALVVRGSLGAGEWVLVNAAGSGVGSAAIQVARLRGARVIASAGSDAKLARALEAGAEAVVNYRTDDLAARVREITGGRGVDLVLESVGGELLGASLAALARGGRVVTVGGHGGEIVPVDVIQLFRNEWSLIGSSRSTRDELHALLELFARGELQTVIDRVLPLARAAEAHEILERRVQYGKVLLVP